MSKLIAMLKEQYTLRSLGRTEEVVELIGDNEKHFAEVFRGIFNKDAVVRLRSIDAVEKVGKQHPEWIRKRQSQIINRLDDFKNYDVQQMHVALLAEHMNLNLEDATTFLDYRKTWAKQDQKWVRTSCITGAGFLAHKHQSLRRPVIAFIESVLRKDSSKAVIKRGEKVLDSLRD
jgi:hypothetical protein